MRHLRDASNPFNSPDELFRKMCRFARNLAHDVFHEINYFLGDGQRTTKMPAVTQVGIGTY
jgi:hypothetical protein